MKIVLNFIAFALAIGSASGQCSLCPSGSGSIEDADYKIHDLADSCGDIDARLAGVDDGDCEAELLSTNFEFDYSAACCSDVSVESISCGLCPEGQWVINPMVTVPNRTLTCGEVEKMAGFVSDGDSFTCKQFRAVGSESCCGTSYYSGQCQVCPPFASLVSGAKQIPGLGLTCQQLDQSLNILPEENCTEVKVQAEFLNYDIQAFCGCTGVTPASTCQFCRGKFTNQDTEVAGSGGALCADFERLESFIKPDSCSTYKDACCEMPTKPPTTDAAHTTSSFLVVVALSVMTLLFSQL